MPSPRTLWERSWMSPLLVDGDTGYDRGVAALLKFTEV